MFIQNDELRQEIKRRLRETRETRWHMSQEEMAEMLRQRLNLEEGSYPSVRSYVRWESLASPELPQGKRLNQVVSVMDIDVSDLMGPVAEGETPQFLVLRKMDEILQALQRIEAKL